MWHDVAKSAHSVDVFEQIIYIYGLAEAMVENSWGSSHLADCHPPMEKLYDSLRNAFFGLDSGLLFIPNYRI